MTVSLRHMFVFSPSIGNELCLGSLVVLSKLVLGVFDFLLCVLCCSVVTSADEFVAVRWSDDAVAMVLGFTMEGWSSSLPVVGGENSICVSWPFWVGGVEFGGV